MCIRIVMVMCPVTGDYREAESDDPVCSCSNVIGCTEEDEWNDRGGYG